MLFVIQYKPKRNDFIDTATDAEADAVGRHFEYLQGLLAEGKLKLAGRRADGDFGIALLEGVSAESAQEILANDPIIREGVFQGTVGEFKLALEKGQA